MNKEEINLLTIKLLLNYYKKDITERYAKCIDNIALDNDVLYTNEKVFITTLEKYIELQQENIQLKERISYLERSNDRREETIELERKENLELHNKIDKAIEWCKDNLDKYSYAIEDMLKDGDVDG